MNASKAVFNQMHKGNINRHYLELFISSGKNICEGGDEMDITSAEGGGAGMDPATGQAKHGGCGR